MPITKQAIKKRDRDRKVQKHNTRIRRKTRDTVKAMRNHPTKKALSLAYKTLDKAAKGNIIHKNRAARLKSRLARLLKK